MNQLLNLIAYGLLPKDQQVGFCPEAKTRGMYEIYRPGLEKWIEAGKNGLFLDEATYRLKLLPEEWYWCKWSDGHLGEALKGKDLVPRVKGYNILRPATPEEIPKPEPTLLERIEAAYPHKRIELLMWEPELCLPSGDKHIHAQSIKGFDGFIYDWKDEANDLPFTKIFPPVRLGCHPIAAVFNK